VNIVANLDARQFARQNIGDQNHAPGSLRIAAGIFPGSLVLSRDCQGAVRRPSLNILRRLLNADAREAVAAIHPLFDTDFV